MMSGATYDSHVYFIMSSAARYEAPDMGDLTTTLSIHVRITLSSCIIFMAYQFPVWCDFSH